MRGNYLIARIAVLVNTGQRSQLYDYVIPPEYVKVIHEGAKVTVPFGNRPVHGYVFELSAEPETTSPLKPISDLEPEELWLTPGQINLARWISDYYLSPLATVLETMVPGGFQGKYQLYYQAASLEGGLEFEAGELSPQARSIYSYLVNKSKPVSRREICTAFGSAADYALRELVAAGVVLKRHQLSAETVRAKTLKGYLLTSDDCEKLTELQQKVVTYLGEHSPATYNDILQATGVSREVVKGLVKKGLVTETTLTQNRRPLELSHQPQAKELQLTPDQAKIFNRISAQLGQGFSVHLIHGVTGSGKTEIYKRLTKAVLATNKSVLILVPEIALTPQIAAEFNAAFPNLVAVLHSRLSTGERFDEWNRIRLGQARVILGARSAVFAPLVNPGLIIVDEEHENSYKQGEAPFYHAPTVAEELARQSGAVLVLGSATPSITSYYRATTGTYHLHTLPKRIGRSLLPTVEICDMREELKAGNRSIFSRSLLNRVEEALQARQQVILFLNRRGYASFVLCRSCGHVIRCPNCEVSLTVHRALPRLACHYCLHEAPLAKSCPICKSPYIRDFGVGTERVEREIYKYFPSARVARLDGETSLRKGSIQKILGAFAAGQTDILVGTQMVAKGLDFPRVTVVGVIAADLTLNMPDFASSERTFQLISQVAGRAGRGDVPGHVVVQTYNPEHYSIVAAAGHDYAEFYQQELLFRRRLNYPPFCAMVLISISSPQEDTGLEAATLLEQQLRGELSPAAKVLSVHPAPLPKLRNRYRYQIVIKWPAPAVSDQDRLRVYHCSQKITGTHEADLRISIDVDPVSFL